MIWLIWYRSILYGLWAMGPVRYGVIFESFACKTIRTCTFAYSLNGSVDFKRYLFTMILSGEFRSHSKKLPFLRTLKISLTYFFKLILCWWRPSCLATGPEVKECRIKIFSKVQELLMLQYQEQFQSQCPIMWKLSLLKFLKDWKTGNATNWKHFAYYLGPYSTVSIFRTLDIS